MKIKITRTHNHNLAHRAGIWVCPHCDWQDEGDNKLSAFDKFICAVVLETVHGKHGSVVTVSECPKCHKKSWVHAAFHSFSEWSDHTPEVKMAVKEEHARRHTQAVSRFADSLCAKCVYLRKLECDTLPIVSCTHGKTKEQTDRYMPSCFTETECKDFLARP